MNRSNAARWLRLLIVMLLAAGVTLVLVFQSGTRGAFRPGPQPPATLPVYSYAGVDPALIPALEAPPVQGQQAFVIDDMPPLGVYLPATGNTQLALPTLTPVPTLTATTTPVPSATPTTTPIPITPSVTPTATIPPPPTFTPWVNTPPAECAPSGWPVTGVLTQYYAWYHRAIDLGIPSGTTVVATHSGTVKFAGWRTDGYGYLVIIESGQFITYYAHLSDYSVIQGQQVNRGQAIGLSGSTGNSSGPHVHYEIRINDSEVDPLTFEKRGYSSC